MRPHASDDRASGFVNSHTAPGTCPLVPEVTLALARDPIGIWQAADEEGHLRPFWAFAWPGGQALARLLLDTPSLVAGKRVIDVGSGSAISAIAAAKAGARAVTAADVDPVACAAAATNAALNGVSLIATDADVLGSLPEADAILIGDLFYEPELATRVSRFLEAAHRVDIAILYADRTTARRPALHLDLLAEHEATPCPALVEDHVERARVWVSSRFEDR